tara:strand:+ start:3504 stop:5189 length:1686 start_codon:yes stop_codon:yes gene_type:complete
MIGTILFFFIICFCFGSLITRKLKFEDGFEQIVISIGVGLGLVSIWMVFTNLLRIPLVWFDLLLFSLFIVVVFKIKLKKIKFDRYSVGALVISLVLLIVMLFGSYRYPYLEDSDPWQHAESAKYVSIEKTLYQPENYTFHYTDSYPPVYTGLMGILHQTNDSISDTLKIFNCIMLALAILFFYYFAKVLFKDKKKALLSTFIIACLPSFMSHIIWAQTLAVCLMFVGFYCLLRQKESLLWMIPSVIIVAGIYLIQPSTAIIFSIMVFIIWLGKTDMFFRYIHILYSLLLGVLVSMLWWGDMILRYGLLGAFNGLNGDVSNLLSVLTTTRFDGSKIYVYNVFRFLAIPLKNKIDQPIGLGLVVCFLLILGVYHLISVRKKYFHSSRMKIIIMWLVFTFIGIQGNLLPVQIFPHRFWVFFSIPVALLLAEVIIERYDKLPIVFWTVIGLIILFNAVPKVIIQTDVWSTACGLDCIEETEDMAFLNQLPKNTNVFTYPKDIRIIGYDMYQCFWCDDYIYNTTGVFDYIDNSDYEYVLTPKNITTFEYKYIKIRSTEYWNLYITR